MEEAAYIIIHVGSWTLFHSILCWTRNAFIMGGKAVLLKGNLIWKAMRTVITHRCERQEGLI